MRIPTKEFQLLVSWAKTNWIKQKIIQLKIYPPLSLCSNGNIYSVGSSFMISQIKYHCK